MAAAGLSVAATYYEVPDHVEVVAALVDSSSEPLNPIEVRFTHSGTKDKDVYGRCSWHPFDSGRKTMN